MTNHITHPVICVPLEHVPLLSSSDLALMHLTARSLLANSVWITQPLLPGALASLDVALIPPELQKFINFMLQLDKEDGPPPASDLNYTEYRAILDQTHALPSLNAAARLAWTNVYQFHILDRLLYWQLFPLAPVIPTSLCSNEVCTALSKVHPYFRHPLLLIAAGSCSPRLQNGKRGLSTLKQPSRIPGSLL
jgi:hypothetical protein